MRGVLFDVFSYVGETLAVWYFALFLGLFIITNVSRFNKMSEDEFKKSLISYKLIGLVVLLMQIVLIIGEGSESFISYMKLPQYCIKNNSGWVAIVSFGIYIVLLRISLWE